MTSTVFSTTSYGLPVSSPGQPLYNHDCLRHSEFPLSTLHYQTSPLSVEVSIRNPVGPKSLPILYLGRTSFSDFDLPSRTTMKTSSLRPPVSRTVCPLYKQDIIIITKVTGFFFIHGQFLFNPLCPFIPLLLFLVGIRLRTTAVENLQNTKRKVRTGMYRRV